MKNIQTLDQIKTKYYGEVGTPERDRLENELEALRIGFKIRSAREQLDMTQEQLAERINKKRTYISAWHCVSTYILAHLALSKLYPFPFRSFQKVYLLVAFIFHGILHSLCKG